MLLKQRAEQDSHRKTTKSLYTALWNGKVGQNFDLHKSAYGYVYRDLSFSFVMLRKQLIFITI